MLVHVYIERRKEKTKKKVEIAIAMMLLVFPLISIPNGYSTVTSNPEGVRTIAAFGNKAESFASLVSTRTGLMVTSGVIDGSSVAIIISDLKKVDMCEVDYALQNLVIVVALNLPANNDLIPVPTLEENVGIVELAVDQEEGTVLSERVMNSSGIKTIYPEYWIGTIRNDEAIFVSYSVLMVDSPEQHMNLFEVAAEKVANMLSSSTYAEASYPDPGSEWSKKFDVEYTYDLTGVWSDENDQLYTRYEVFELTYWDDVVMKEYWRTDAYIDHWLPSYVENFLHCGPYVHTRQIIVDSDWGDLYDYGPPTTPKNTGVSVNIGFTVSSGGIGINVGYSWSWSNPGCWWDVAADYVNDVVTWDESFSGPDYLWWPIIFGPDSTAHNSYNAKPSLIMRSDVGSGFDISTLQSKWVIYDDTDFWIDPLFPFIIHWTRYIYTYTKPWYPSSITSMFPHPNTPSTPYGYSSGYTYTSYSYSTSTTDPDGYNVRYQFDWGDGQTTTTGYYASGATVSRSHSWSSVGWKYVKVRAQNTEGFWSPWSSRKAVYITTQPSCVAEGTPVTMADGSSKPIEEIKKGDQVLGYDPATGSYMAENVLDTIKHQVEVIVNINNGMLKLTPLDQPIYYRNSTYEGWMRDPANIQVGWEIYNATSNGWVPVTSVTFEEGKTRVYDLVLDGYTTYIANGILLMDKC